MTTAMDTRQIDKILKEHKKWLEGDGGQRADFRLTDLRNANFRGADLRNADFRITDLRNANFRGADLRNADLWGANLRGADFRGAKLDFSCLPLWCGSIGIKTDKRLFSQLLFHLTRLDVSGCGAEVREVMNKLRKMPEADWFCNYRNDIQMLKEEYD